MHVLIVPHTCVVCAIRDVPIVFMACVDNCIGPNLVLLFAILHIWFAGFVGTSLALQPVSVLVLGNAA